MNPILDNLLPLLQPQRLELFVGAALLEVTDSAQLAELAADPKIRRYLLGRLADTVALVDPGQVDALVKTLRGAGHTPKMVKGMAS
jgi:hypothetical protein